jgi:hypothetical protein
VLERSSQNVHIPFNQARHLAVKLGRDGPSTTLARERLIVPTRLFGYIHHRTGISSHVEPIREWESRIECITLANRSKECRWIEATQSERPGLKRLQTSTSNFPSSIVRQGGVRDLQLVAIVEKASSSSSSSSLLVFSIRRSNYGVFLTVCITVSNTHIKWYPTEIIAS